MGLREELQKRIARKEAEIKDYNEKIREANAFIQGLQDAMKLVPRSGEGGIQEVVLRQGGNAAKARNALRQAGKPLHITEILKAIGQPIDKNHKLALAGSLAAYVRKEQVFTRPEPNTFGLQEFIDNANDAMAEIDSLKTVTIG